MDQLIKSELFHTKRICKRSHGDIQNFNMFVFVCVLKGFPTIFVRISQQEIRFAPRKKGSKSEKTGFFGGPHCWFGRRGGVFQSVRELWGVGILNHMDMFSEKSGGINMLRQFCA